MHIIPFGDRILVRRRTINEDRDSSIVLPDSVKERPTDLADVEYIPEHSFCDTELISQATAIIYAQTGKAKEGDSEALKALLLFNDYLKIKSVQVGDVVMISKYVGIDFHDNAVNGNMTLVQGSDIIGVVSDEEDT